MTGAERSMQPWKKKLMLGGFLILLAGGALVWYIFSEEFEDTNSQKAAFEISAMQLINEFQQNDSLANATYADQILTVNGRVSATEKVDSTLNIKMEDEDGGAYIIFAFQPQDTKAVTQFKAGDSVSIKGSCSGGIYSEILETQAITFKRCTIN